MISKSHNGTVSNDCKLSTFELLEYSKCFDNYTDANSVNYTTTIVESITVDGAGLITQKVENIFWEPRKLHWNNDFYAIRTWFNCEKTKINTNGKKSVEISFSAVEANLREEIVCRSIFVFHRIHVVSQVFNIRSLFLEFNKAHFWLFLMLIV